jgi:hypothetical protein
MQTVYKENGIDSKTEAFWFMKAIKIEKKGRVGLLVVELYFFKIQPIRIHFDRIEN